MKDQGRPIAVEPTPTEIVVDAVEGEPVDGWRISPGAVTAVPDPFAGFYQATATLRVGSWAGLPNYECSACGFDSLNQARTEAHLSIHGQTFTQGADL